MRIKAGRLKREIQVKSIRSGLIMADDLLSG